MTKKQIKLWIEKMGGRDKAAAVIGVNPATIWRWRQHPERIKHATVMFIEASLKND